MSAIKVNLPGTTIPVNGLQVSFRVPCGSSAKAEIMIDDRLFEVVDANGQRVSSCAAGSLVDEVWVPGAMLSVILDVTNSKAYLLNATNVGFGKFSSTAGDGCYSHTTRSRTQGVEKQEWLNPPMRLDVEYLTTERWNGNPVYRMLHKIDAIPSSSTPDLPGPAVTYVLPSTMLLEGTLHVRFNDGKQYPAALLGMNIDITVNNIDGSIVFRNKMNADPDGYFIFEMRYTK